MWCYCLSKILLNRAQEVTINGCLSVDVKVKIGVPQESVLGRLIFPVTCCL